MSMSSSVSSMKKKLHCLGFDLCMRCYLLPSLLQNFGYCLCLLSFFSFIGSSSLLVSFSSLFFFIVFLYFRFLCTTRRSILRCVDRINLSCSCETVHVLEAYVSVGVMTKLNEQSMCRRRYDFDVNTCLHLVNDAHAARTRLLISVVSCCSNAIACPKYFTHSFTGNTSTLMLSIVTSILLFDTWLRGIFVLSGLIFSSTHSVLFLTSHIIYLSCSRDVQINRTSSAKRRFERQSAC